MNLSKQIKQSQKLLLDCCLPNGAIVAWNGQKKYASKNTNNYYFVWIRDAAFVCLALDLLGEKEKQKKFFNWCGRTLDFKTNGLFLKRYKVDGAADNHNKFFQPDQNGILLYSIWHHFVKSENIGLNRYINLVKGIADGLVGAWEKNHFIHIAENIWENDQVFPDVPQNFIYTLAACSRGLECAYLITGNKQYQQTAAEMRVQILKPDGKYFYKTVGKLLDKNIDASLLGLVYPFEIIQPRSAKMKKTVSLIEEKLVLNGGVYRFENDNYDGWMHGEVKRNLGAGAWPLLNFWLAIYWARAGKDKKAKVYFNWVEDRVNKLIPEQIFSNNIQRSVSPLAWSHAMHIIAFFELHKCNNKRFIFF